MSFIQNLFTSRDNNANGNSYVGQEDRIWWNPDTNAFYYSDGNTAGGILITGGSTGNGVPGGAANTVQYNAGSSTFGGDPNFTFDSSTSTLSITNIVANTIVGGAGGSNTQVQFNTNGNFTGNPNFTFNSATDVLTMTGSAYLGNVLAQANNVSNLGTATHRFNDIWLGSGNINLVDDTLNIPQQIRASNGNLYITGGNGLVFGQFAMYENIIETIDGNANITVGRATDTAYFDVNRPLAVNSTGGGLPAFAVETNGTVSIFNSNAAANTAGALNIVGSTARTYQNVTNSGGMIHVTGPDNSAARVTVDAFGTVSGAGAFAQFIGRSGRGNSSTPQPVQSGDIMARYAGVGWIDATNKFLALGKQTPTSIELVATQTYSAGNTGSQINIYTAPINTDTRTLSASITANGLALPNVSQGGSGTAGITFADGSFQNTAYQSTSVVRSLTAGSGISLSSNVGNITITNTGVLGIVGTVNQISITGNVGNVVTLGTPQDIAPTSNVTFNTLTVNNLSIIGNVSNVIPAVVNGPVIYVANTATTYNDLDNSGLSTGNISNNYYASILYQTSSNTWKFDIGNSQGITTGNVYGNSGLFEDTLHVGNAASGGYDFPNALLQGDINIDSYGQYVLRNHSQTANASSDIVAVANNGDDSSYYIDMGINSNVYANVDYAVTGANDGYLYVNGGNLVIGTQTAGKVIDFFTGGTDNTNKIRGTLSDTGLSMVGNVTANNMISVNATIGGVVSAVGNVTGGNLISLNIVSAAGNILGLNVNAGIISATGNIRGGNINTTGLVSTTGNVQAGNINTTGAISSTGNIIAANIAAGNITTAIMSATGNITGPNINATLLSISASASVTGNIQSGNILTTGLISATGNITGNYYLGNGSLLTGISLPRISNGTSEVNIPVASSNANITIGATSNVAVFATTGAYITGVASATGNVHGGNVVATANVTTANLTVTGISNLNSNANVRISGGIPGQSLITDGAGNLSWSSGTGGNTVILNGNSTNTVNIDFTYNSTTLLYLPTANVTVTLANYTAGHTARVIVRYGTPYTLAMGVANVQQTTEGATTIPITGSGGHKIGGNQSVQLLYTCFDNTAANCYVASTFL